MSSASSIPDERRAAKTIRQDAPRGLYARRLAAVESVPGGMRAPIDLIGFADIGDERRPLILSDEPLARQWLHTHVPNTPKDAADTDTLRPRYTPALLDVHVLAPRIVRIRLGAEASLSRDRAFGMLAPGALEALALEQPAAHIEEIDDSVSLSAGEITIRLSRDPFAIRVGQAGAPDRGVETALDDRNVHGALCTPPPGLRSTSVGDIAFWSWALTPDERLYGLGERFTQLDHRGERVTLWTSDAWGTTTAASYKNVPFLLSSRGYGLFFHTPTPVTFDLGTRSQRAALAEVGEDSLDLFLVFGETPKDILREYTRLTGRPTLIPPWALGVWLSRCRYQSRAEVEAVAQRARAEDVPCDVLHLDPAWLELPGLNCDFVASEQAFPDLPGMVRDLGKQGFKISLWELPYVSSEAKRFQEAANAGYFLRDEQGEPICADFGGPPPDGKLRAVVDFTNPDAKAWWQDLHRPWLRAGVAVFKTDFGEGAPAAAHAFNGMTGRELHNLYPLLYNAVVHEVITEETGRPGMVWGRSGWAGTQRYPAQWGGDPKTDAWSMAASLRGGLSLALSAPGIWAHDIGGFYGPPPSPELYIRWAQFGLLSPLARAHGTTPREPWEFGDEALAIFRRYAKLRMRLHPYLYALAWEAHEHGLPMLRPLALEFPSDPAAAEIEDAYLLGPDLLVAPVFSDTRDPVARQLYLPRGDWYDFWTGERVAGGRYITRTCPLDTIPVYARAGAIVPLGPERSHIDEIAPDSVTLEVYTGAAGAAPLVWDASGTATRVRLMTDAADGEWPVLTIDGDREAEWSIRWHGEHGVAEESLGRCATAEAHFR